MKVNDITPLALNVNQACKLVGVSRSSLYIRIMSGELRSVKLGKRRLVLYADLLAWCDGLTNETHAA